MREHYLDNNATTRPDDRVIEVMSRLMAENYGNPSSLHKRGIDAEAAVRQARRQVAEALGCEAGEILFTSGGTEANNLALFGACEARRRTGSRVVVTNAEHASVLETAKELEARGYEVIRLSTKNGEIDEEELLAAIDEKTILVSMMLVNNETGAVFPVPAARRAIAKKKAPALLHCDAVAAFGRIQLTAAATGADLITVSAHKIHGPKGAGALYIKKGTRIRPQHFGGGQEGGLRPGTENTYAIAGFGEAVRLTFEDPESKIKKLISLRRRCIDRLGELVPEAKLHLPVAAAPHILNLSLPGLNAETMLHFLAMRGIYVSSGSACSSHKKGGSHVLNAMGLPREQVLSALRVSFSPQNGYEDADALAEGLLACKNELMGRL